jgi:hypothetical protein
MWLKITDVRQVAIPLSSIDSELHKRSSIACIGKCTTREEEPGCFKVAISED